MHVSTKNVRWATFYPAYVPGKGRCNSHTYGLGEFAVEARTAGDVDAQLLR